MELQLKHSLFCFETMLLLLFKSCTKTGVENGFLKYMENMLRLLSLKVNNSWSNLSDNSIENHGPSVRSIYEKVCHAYCYENNSWNTGTVSNIE